MKINDIYYKFNIPIFLQEHMFRVAAVTEMICRETTIELDKSIIVQSALVHDLGNIVKINFEKLNAFFKDEDDKNYWKEYKQKVIDKYGKTANEATRNMLLDLNVNGRIFDYLDWVGAKNLKTKNDDDFNKENLQFIILPYADSRVSPFGIVSFEERAKEAAARYSFPNEETKNFIALVKKLENIIFKNCNIKPKDITDESVRDIIEEVKQYNIEILDI